MSISINWSSMSEKSLQEVQVNNNHYNGRWEVEELWGTNHQ